MVTPVPYDPQYVVEIVWYPPSPTGTYRDADHAWHVPDEPVRPFINTALVGEAAKPAAVVLQ